jgi:hypothetical protein
MEERTMTRILATLLIATTLTGAGAYAEDRLKVSMENGRQRVDFSLNGIKCVMVNDRIVCAALPNSPVRVASSEEN